MLIQNTDRVIHRGTRCKYPKTADTFGIGYFQAWKYPTQGEKWTYALVLTEEGQIKSVCIEDLCFDMGDE